MISRREMLLQTGLLAGVTAMGRFAVAESAGTAQSGADATLFARMDEFARQYLEEMHAPGMTLVLADRKGLRRVVHYGFGDVERRVPVRDDQLFEIGSISKSFVAVCLLQLHDEGKLDLHKPVVEYLPWFRIDSAFAPITTHHLLTHGAGLPGNVPLLPSDPSLRHRAAYAPGEHFHYCNMAYEALGHLAWTLDGRELPEVIRKRILEPLGMTQSEPVITLDIRERLVKNYSAFQNDRPGTRDARFAEAAGLIVTTGAGSVAATAKDMGAYLRMIANGGEGPNGRRLMSKESFALFTRAHIVAPEFGPTASYGYGLAVDKLDGHTVVRHTGGMVSFMSSLLVDIDNGVGAFASINAQQGYRPTAVTEYAVQLMREQQASKPLPNIPPPNPALRVPDAADYAGSYQQSGGGKLEIQNDGDKLFLVRANGKVPLQPAGAPGAFIVADGGKSHFPLVFGRADAKDPKSAVVEVAWGSDWYTNSKYRGEKQFTAPKEWQTYVGHYRNENPWIGSMRIVLRKGRLWIDGMMPLEPAGDRFNLRDVPHSPEWIQFGEIVNGRCMRLKFSGEDLWRVATA
nr:serine hydrolase domain-containing protein [uncultured Steroidobacter sp.]